MSAILGTARPDYPLLHDRAWHVFGGPAACLRAQTLTDIEWIIVDLAHGDRAGWAAENPQPFPVRHVPIKDNPWFPARRKTARAATLNTGARRATGDVLVFFDDAWTFGPTFLADHAARVAEGFAVASLYTAAERPGDPPVPNDSRFASLSPDGRRVRLPHEPYGTPATFGGVGVSREAFFRVGGYEELMDSGWGLEDMEIGWRLQASGVPVLLDAAVTITAYPATSYLPIFDEPRFTLCCENLLRRKLERGLREGDWRGNARAWTPAEQAMFLPRCHYHQADGSCSVYGPTHPCNQPTSVHHPDADDPDVRLALTEKPAGLG